MVLVNKNDLGFAHLFLIVVALVLAIGGLIYYSWQKGLIKTTPNQEPSPTPTSAEIEKFETQEDCESKLEHKLARLPKVLAEAQPDSARPVQVLESALQGKLELEKLPLYFATKRKLRVNCPKWLQNLI